MIFGVDYESSETRVNEVVPQIVDLLPTKRFKCRICKRIYPSYRSIFYHIAVIHKDLISKYEEQIKRMRRWWLYQ